MSNQTVTNTQIVSGIFQGNNNAEVLLVQRYSRTVLFLIEKRTGDPQLAQDICQETFLILIRKFREQLLEEPEKLSAYVQRTAKNVLIAHIRKEVRRDTHADTDAIEAYSAPELPHVNEIDMARLQKVVRESVLGLGNERDREVLYRYYIQEHDKELICHELKIDFRHFDKVISRARSRLKASMGQAGTDQIMEVLG